MTNKEKWFNLALLIVYYLFNCFEIADSVPKPGLLIYLILAFLSICVLLFLVKNNGKKQVGISSGDAVMSFAAINSLNYMFVSKENIIRYVVPEAILMMMMLFNVKYEFKTGKALTKFSIITVVAFVICLLLFA